MKSSKFTHAVKLVAGALALISLAACQGTLLSYRGRAAKPENRIELKTGGPYHGFYQSRDIAVDYTYLNRADAFQFSGVVKFDNALVYNFRTVENFSLQLNFLDAEGKVIDTTWLASSGYRQEIDDLPFSRTLALPLGTTGLAFSYSGRAREGGSSGDESPNGGDTWDFWMTP